MFSSLWAGAGNAIVDMFTSPPSQVDSDGAEHARDGETLLRFSANCDALGLITGKRGQGKLRAVRAEAESHSSDCATSANRAGDGIRSERTGK
jgi:hypothetical protein